MLGKSMRIALLSAMLLAPELAAAQENTPADAQARWLGIYNSNMTAEQKGAAIANEVFLPDAKFRGAVGIPPLIGHDAIQAGWTKFFTMNPKVNLAFQQPLQWSRNADECGGGADGAMMLAYGTFAMKDLGNAEGQMRTQNDTYVAGYAKGADGRCYISYYCVMNSAAGETQDVCPK